MKSRLVTLLIGLGILLASASAGAITYTYDDLNRLTAVTYDNGASIAYAYDAAGNLTSISKTPPGAGSSTTTTTTTTTQAQTTTTTAQTTTTTSSTTTTTVAGGGAFGFITGWNLVGNGTSGTLDVAVAFGDTNKVVTVWKWIAASAKWAFYAPSLSGQQLSDYAASKGYDALTTINSGEGFWVNAKAAFSVPLPGGSAISSSSFQGVASGWSLIAIGDNKTPKAFNIALSTTQPAAEDIPLNVISLWAWDAVQGNWYFYAPSKDKDGTLASYIASKGYLDFGSTTLSPTTGFWVNVP